MAIRVGVDTGGTFTDFVFEVNGRLQIFKLASTPADPSLAITEGLRRIAEITGVTLGDVEVVHGTTVGTTAGATEFAHMLLKVSDLKRSERFYVDLLGFKVRPAKPLADGRPFVPFTQGLALTAGGPQESPQIELDGLTPVGGFLQGEEVGQPLTPEEEKQLALARAVLDGSSEIAPRSSKNEGLGG